MSPFWMLWIVVAYVAGSVPFGYLLGRAHGVDIRAVGSGNVGATNLGRLLGRKWGVLCLLLDMLKGAMPVLIAGLAMETVGWRQLPAEQAWPWLMVGAAAVLGHVFPVWLRFRGGKGVATSLGVLLGFWPVLTLAAVAGVATWLLLVALFRYVSLASMLASVAVPIYLVIGALLTSRPISQMLPFVVVTALVAALVVLRHRANVSRLLAGTEPQIRRGGK